MSNLALKMDSVSKLYSLGQVGTGTLSHDLNRWWAKRLGKEDPGSKVGAVNDREQSGDEFVWALRDIDFEVNQGEIIGIIGRNGAGKSTLLKLLSRVTGPTTGKIYINGKIASLLEVGTGFHMELTGRENIFLNGAILGMSKKEISSKFDEIVDFSGCAKYIDTPVKRYSSGMHVRLAFAVAAHLEPDILIVDEVLAVGDAEFQKKCISKLKELSTGFDRTVLFVSHNLVAIERLCTRAMLIDKGQVRMSGAVTKVLNEYRMMGVATSQISLADRVDRIGSQEIICDELFFVNTRGERVESTKTGEDLICVLEYRCTVTGIKDAEFNINFFNFTDDLFFKCSTKTSGIDFGANLTSGRLECRLPNFPLTEGQYYVNVFCADKGGVCDNVVKAKYLTVIDGNYYRTGWSASDPRGGICVEQHWSLI